MSEPTNQELKELILSLFNQLDRKIDTQFGILDKKIEALDKKTEVQFMELKGEIKRVETKLEGEIQRLETEIKAAEERLTSQMRRLETELKVEIKRIDDRFDGFDKRIANEELISRSAFGTLLLGLVTAIVKLLFFPDRP
ncbi:MAG: hypothetical protein NZL92_06535 [Gloeomargarita sp. SKYG116]|nr:hypothetical protein [Gloeomargarita sp. SKYG116]MCS7291492.1 hypothetical protein [Gloeomargarita sp. SKYB120]MDW8177052.1 hypothetical protein [Gloeomargarita sp. SKYBB_i_bin120]MDW8401337.1 hypothetical protein [Gloeomargarita sp. SKYGB_i_bin116]